MAKDGKPKPDIRTNGWCQLNTAMRHHSDRPWARSQFRKQIAYLRTKKTLDILPSNHRIAANLRKTLLFLKFDAKEALVCICSSTCSRLLA